VAGTGLEARQELFGEMERLRGEADEEEAGEARACIAISAQRAAHHRQRDRRDEGNRETGRADENAAYGLGRLDRSAPVSQAPDIALMATVAPVR